MKYNFKGLTAQEVLTSREKQGSNELSPHEIDTFWDKLISNFKNPIIIILTGALFVMIILSVFSLTEWYEAVAIAVAVALATLVSTFSEYKNESAFQKLQEEASQVSNTVFREGKLMAIPVNEIVSDDYVLLQAGDKIPADGIVVKGELKVNQASLTGESDTILKTAIGESNIEVERKLSLPYCLYRGAVVDEGEAVMKVETVGDHSFYGKLAQELSSNEDRLSPLQVKLGGLASLISKFGYIAAIFIAVIFVFNKAVVANEFNIERIVQYFSDWTVYVPDLLDALVLSIIIVVAAIPEGLPMMIAIVLALNMRKLLIDKVLVRRLLGIETAGSLNILFSDKTGTITKGELKPKLFISGSGQLYDGFSDIPDSLKSLLKLSIVENSSAYISPDGEAVGGNASERALISFVKETNLSVESNCEQQNKILFNSEWKFSASEIKMATVHSVINSDVFTLVKGAPEVVLNDCEFYFDEQGKKLPIQGSEKLLSKMDELADSGIRLIAIAVSMDKIKEDGVLPENRVMLGVVGIADEIRKESKQAIMEVQNAGIQVVMITGDRQGTAESIAGDVGLYDGKDDISLVSADLNKYTDEEIKEILPNITVISRALPTDKSRLVRISKMLGKVVGMTGDGVNDSAALKQADVGVAMGSGSEVSKEAGDIVILDDNFHSINNAIRYGRTIFKSIRKFIVFQLTVNVAAVTTAFIGPMIGVDFPLTIIQLLWVNIIMDTLAAIAFGGEPALMRYMDEPPVMRDENILTKEMKVSILTSGIFITGISFIFLLAEPIQQLFVRDGIQNMEVHLSAFFNVFIFLIIFNGFNVRTSKINLFDHFYKNKKFMLVMGFIILLQIAFTYIGGDVLRMVGLTFFEWLVVFGFAIIIVPVGMIVKIVLNTKR
ncbi:MAG: calcium-translocating P-type ATPase, PMCA-type [Cyclobacteriaceae bacterium]|nr:calcium-translocating P-type ATPase, PMCA-type [Cyclobacteriaceae bacterium]